jgi:chromosome segregation ATPase
MRKASIVLAILVTAAAAGVVFAGGDDRMSYIYHRADDSHTHVSGAAIDRIGPIVKKYGREFVWLRLDGRSYVIRDAATLGEIRNAFRELDAMHAPMETIENRMKPFEEKMEAIEQRIDALSDQLDDEDLSDSMRDAIDRKMQTAEDEMHDIERQMQGIEREMEKLEKETERLEKIADAKFEEIVQRAVRTGVAQRE